MYRLNDFLEIVFRISILNLTESDTFPFIHNLGAGGSSLISSFHILLKRIYFFLVKELFISLAEYPISSHNRKEFGMLLLYQAFFLVRIRISTFY